MPIVILEKRGASVNSVAETRQGAIGMGLAAEGITPVYADFGSPESFTHDGAIKAYDILSNGYLQPPDNKQPVYPDAYRIRGLPDDKRPEFAQSNSTVSGYNSGKLCEQLLSRVGVRAMLRNFAEYMPPATQTDRQSLARALGAVAGDMVFMKPTTSTSDVLGDTAKHIRRAHYLRREEVASRLNDPRFTTVLLQEDVAAPLDDIMQRLKISPAGIVELEYRKHHTIRIYHMIGDKRSIVQEPDVAEIRLMNRYDIGRPEPSRYALYEPDEVFAAFADTGLEVLHTRLTQEIADKYGLNYCAVDYFLTRENKPAINGVHVRPWLPSINAGDSDLSRRTVTSEVRMLTALATEP